MFMNKLLLLLIAGALFFSAQSVYAKKYYSAQGACNDYIYSFDFNAGKITTWVRYRTGGDNPAKHQYMVLKGKLNKLDEHYYQMIFYDGSTARLERKEESDIWWAESKKDGKFYFSVCDIDKAKKFIKIVTKYTSQDVR